MEVESKALQAVYSDFRNVGSILYETLSNLNIEMEKIGYLVTDDGGACPHIHWVLETIYAADIGCRML